MGKKYTIGGDKSETVAAIPHACSNERAAVEFMEAQRWEGKPICPRCQSESVYQMMGKNGERQKDYRWRCRECVKAKHNAQFTVRTDTVFEDSRIPLRFWCYAFWRASCSKKGVSALEIKRQTGLNYRSALFLLHRIRFAMAQNPGQLQGDIEVDEAYVGGKPRNKGYRKNPGGRGTPKQPIMAILERGGRVKTSVIPNVTAKTLKGAILENVDAASRIFTDEWVSYKGIGQHFAGGHHVVNHGRKEYVRGEATTNSVESFFAIIKRGLTGIHHAVSKKHLHRYLSHYEFLYNHRKMDDGDRTAAAIRASQGKRLMYKEPSSV